jgi:DNA mismatch repair protein MutS
VFSISFKAPLSVDHTQTVNFPNLPLPRRRVAALSLIGMRYAEPAPPSSDPPAGESVRTSPEGAGITPMMAQYAEIKAANPGCLLFYRMGDFFEMFFKDAEVASQALGIMLTKRGRHLGEDIPMCGVPVARADEYLQKLIAQGFKVAVCEQLEDPAEARKRGAKSVVKRDVVRLVTPGTITEEALLDARAHNFLTALHQVPADEGAATPCYALAAVDISTGEFFVGEASEADLPGELARFAPREVILSDAIDGDKPLAAVIEHIGAARTPAPRAYFSSLAGEEALKSALGVAMLEGFGKFSRGELAAAGALLKYVEITQIGRRPALRPPRRAGASGALMIDAATRVNLELTRSARGEARGGLLSAIDRTVTAPGARELASRLSSPLRDPQAINARLDAVNFLLDEPGARAALRETLKSAPDIARAMSRLSLGRGGPRDLGGVREGLRAASATAKALDEVRGVSGLPSELQSVLDRVQLDETLGAALDGALVDELPHLKRDGGFVRNGYRADLDENRRMRDGGRGFIAGLQAKYAAETGVKSLKVKHNNVLGYFIEAPAGAAGVMQKPPHSERFRHRQTMSNAMRFTTDELAGAESRILGAAERALGLELEIFDELTRKVLAGEPQLSAAAAAMAELDCCAGLAELAAEQDYARPVVDRSAAFIVEGGRHPVVEQALAKARSGPFIENDCRLSAPEGNGRRGSAARLWLVTGPNMAGKSTFLRQNALIAILAQMGAYVPARRVHIGVIDRLFSRVGASDDLARGRSTFMVEMVETAAILNQATERSLVILDEIGRGTATFDGLSIAWATAEHLCEANRCRALFATHYHELTALAERMQGVANVTVAVKEWKDGIVFLHQVVPGAADGSYGIQVARLAGLPRPVIARAREVLARLEGGGLKPGGGDPFEDLPLFAALKPTETTAEAETAGPEFEAEPAGPSPLEEALDAIDPDAMTPRQALEALYRLKGLRQGAAAPA